MATQVTLNSGSVDSAGSLALKTNGTTTAVTIDTSQNVGIGTISPTRKLHISASGSACAVRIDNTVSGRPTLLTYDDSENLTLTNSSDTGYFAFVNRTGAGTERMRIDSGGNLLVGNTSGFGARIHAVTSSASGCIATSATASSGTRYHLVFYENTTERGSITSSGGGVVYNSVSDYRLKENVNPMTGALAKVAQLNPVTYTWKDSESAGEGFIAHELQAVCPAAVTGDKDAVDEKGNPKYQGIDTSVLVATLTAAIQELKALIDTQASTITQLQADVAALKGTA